MTHTHVKLARAAALVATTAALAGCFGGGGDAAPAADPLAAVPESATQSVAGLYAYLVSLIANSSDSRDPIDITALTLPTSDSTEAETVN